MSCSLFQWNQSWRLLEQCKYCKPPNKQRRILFCVCWVWRCSESNACSKMFVEKLKLNLILFADFSVTEGASVTEWNAPSVNCGRCKNTTWQHTEQRLSHQNLNILSAVWRLEESVLFVRKLYFENLIERCRGSFTAEFTAWDEGRVS